MGIYLHKLPFLELLPKFNDMKRYFLCVLFFLTVSLSAQESSNYGLDKRWSVKSGAGFFFVPIETDGGYSLWWEGAYALASRLEFYAKLNYSTASHRFSAEEREKLWPTGEFWGTTNDFYHRNERKAWDYSVLELGVSYPFTIAQRHCIAPGAGLAVIYQRLWAPSHSVAVPIDRLGGYVEYYGEIGDVFYRNRVTLNFSFQVEYSYHFSNGFFWGVRAHAFHDFTYPYITISPLLGVRF